MPSTATSAGNPGTFDLVVLGGGSGGYSAALRAAQLGLSVALIEEDKLGGTCLHNGCIPTKALLHAAEVADVAREGSRFGVRTSSDGIDMAGVHAYKDSVVAGLYKGLRGLVASREVTFVTGHGTLVAPGVVEVDGVRYAGRHVVLATGSYARTLPGLEIGGRVITSDQALTLDHVPSSVVVLGGGVIGVEFASVWRSFGAEVQIVEALDHLVPAEDLALSKALERAFRKRGIGFTLGDRFAEVKQSDDGVRVTLESGKSFDADLLLVAVGRGPRTADLGFEAAGVPLRQGFVVTDERLRTGVTTPDGGHVWAVGDIVPGLQLAHRGFAQGIFVAESVAAASGVSPDGPAPDTGLREPMPVDEATIPRITYCEPEVASVGVTQARAEELYGADAVETLEYNLAGNGKSRILDTTGFAKLVRRKDGPVVGMHLIGSRVGELIGEGQLIVGWEAFPEDVASLVHAHPTQNEALGEAHMALAGKPLHAHN
ncbi:dihydrolipoamide dehydrogenase [Myceligenerans xiligouense]|uniref:Dihydrolipoyl dehydrogenase n=1 Tax=Myceligenerans xiligouense TaxID=253184 RepID=A0A3N4Z6A5_9MICO|nr:dihydrolipoyl dehydrogenase [Myceligenerans xiligouense]RPF20802.1 dihydrolipoamide dehydrogenase [Myceligenerans xiligouense]